MNLKPAYIIYLLLLYFGKANAQGSSNSFPLSEKAKQQIEQNIVNTAVWHRLNELKLLQQNFGNMLGANSTYAKPGQPHLKIKEFFSECCV